jgi:hypothetical protein
MSVLRDLLSPVQAIASRTVQVVNHGVSNGHDGAGWLGREPRSSHGNPVITARDVTDYGAVNFVADPFLYPTDGAWHLFFEVQNGRRDPTAVIGHATSTDRGETWQYDGVVLRHERHLSFPYVFAHNGEIYMLPGQSGDPAERPVTLFRASDFPGAWEPVVDIIDPEYGPLDAVVFRHSGRWWAIVGGGNNDVLYAYYSDSLESADWTQHDANPVVTDRVRAGRPAGRPSTRLDDPVLYLQDNRLQYGDAVRAYRVTELTPERYRDEALDDRPMLAGHGCAGWNGGRMHHIDAQDAGGNNDWVCVADSDIGVRPSLVGSCWSIGVYDLNCSPTEAVG